MTRYRPVDAKVRPARARGARARVLARALDLPARDRPARRRARVGVLRGPAHGERQAGHPPRRVAHVQGRVPALPDDARATRSCARAAGTATGCPSSSRWRRRSARSPSATSRRSASPSSTACAASRCSATSTDWERLTERIGVLGRHGRGVLDDEPRVHRVGVVGAEDAARAGPAGAGRADGRVLPALRHRAVRRRGRAGLHAVVDPGVYVEFPVTEGDDRAASAPRSWRGRRRRGRSARTSGLAVDADATYVRASAPGRERDLIVAAPRLDDAARASPAATEVRQVLDEFPGLGARRTRTTSRRSPTSRTGTPTASSRPTSSR